MLLDTKYQPMKLVRKIIIAAFLTTMMWMAVMVARDPATDLFYRMFDTNYTENLPPPHISAPLISPSQAPPPIGHHAPKKSHEQPAIEAEVDIVGVIKVELGENSGWGTVARLLVLLLGS